MVLSVKNFRELTITELFEVYRLRSEVFVVEQNCVYKDVDLKDPEALHVLMMDGNELAGYSRILPPGISYPEPSIGRVVLRRSYRGKGWGKKLMEFTIGETLAKFGSATIVISAQCYLQNFYSELGFSAQGEPYDEDGIPHICMRYEGSGATQGSSQQA